MEEEEAEIPQAQDVVGRLREGLELEFPSNDEKAIVLFKPVNTPLLHSSSSNLSFSVDSHIMSGFKSKHPSFIYLLLLYLPSFYTDSSQNNENSLIQQKINEGYWRLVTTYKF